MTHAAYCPTCRPDHFPTAADRRAFAAERAVCDSCGTGPSPPAVSQGPSRLDPDAFAVRGAALACSGVFPPGLDDERCTGRWLSPSGW